MNFDNVKVQDKEVYDLIESEKNRQQNNIELIASENFVSPSVMEAMGSYLTNKYAEGYPGKRYYGGCIEVDKMENLAIERLKELFNCEHANVQPHSGSQANSSVYAAVLNPGDLVLGMDLSHGGHLTHGSPVNFSGKLYKFASYGVDKETERINYDELEKIAKEINPKMIVCGASAYSREIDFERFRYIADKTGAYLMADIAHIAGLVATGYHVSSIPYAHFTTTTTHKTLRGPRGGAIMCKEEYAKIIDKSIFPGNQGGPLEHVIAAKAVAFKEALDPSFKVYAKNIIDNTKALSKMFTDYGFRVVSGGTDNHLILLDVTNKNKTGKEAENLLDEVNITVNKNTIPYETRSPFITSGIRIGTAAVTTRGFGLSEMKEIARLIDKVLTPSEINKEEIKKEVKEVCDKFPLYAK